MNLFLLHIFVRDTRERLVGAHVGAPTWYPPLLTIPIDNAAGRSHLVAVLESPGPFCFCTEVPPLEGLPAGERLGSATGARIEDVAVHEKDRVLRIDMSLQSAHRGADALTLLIHLYRSTGAAVLSRGDSILESVGRRSRAGARRTQDQPRSLVDVSADALSFFATAGDLTGEASPQRVIAGLDRTLLKVFSSQHGAIDTDALIAFRDGVLDGSIPFGLASDGRIGNVVPVPHDASAEFMFGPFHNAREACATVGAALGDEIAPRILTDLARPLVRRNARNKTLVRNLERDIEKAGQHDQVRREAEILAAFQSRIPAGQSDVELDDIYRPGEKIQIKLDPAESLQAQIDRRFRKATKLERSLTHAGRRLELVRKERAEIEEVLAKVARKTPRDGPHEMAERVASIESARKRFGLTAKRDRGPSARRGEPERTFRQFDLGPDWFVLVGRSNQENDDITFHHAAPADLWFHAQSVPGSHVVLKSRTGAPGNPPARIVEQAAAVAAHFSKARHSGLVPVIYTQRKYVRKFRGAKPGQVRCEREKTVVIAPGVPE